MKKTINQRLREIFGEKVWKLPVNAGFTCPNLDGTLSERGCSFCSNVSFSTAAYFPDKSISEQIIEKAEILRKRKKVRKFIAYFQNYSNTYAPAGILRARLNEALSTGIISGISAGTRPDCISGDVTEVLRETSSQTYLSIELGLQSANDMTLLRINRGHDSASFKKAEKTLSDIGIETTAHVIAGLPGEKKNNFIETAEFLNNTGIRGIKIHNLFVAKNTELESLFHKGKYRPLTEDEYTDWLFSFLEKLRDDIIIHRLVSDPMKGTLISPVWAEGAKTRITKKLSGFFS
ncbi:MAG: TIGR01212 family radical SAM protein [Fibrobacterota bacterium]